ncbi:MAG: hypothetical protein DRO18_04700 [Thermoprotei archaeon]|nr:MAG: hypothetical protein DRO18_04700 [Thermoprotei archaeon]
MVKLPPNIDKLLGFSLIVIGCVLAILVFYYAISEYLVFPGIELQGLDIIDIVRRSAGVLLGLLIKITFLGMGLATAAVVLKYGVRMIKEEKVSEKKEKT